MIDIRHVGIQVSDIKDSLRFYCDILGMKIVSEEEIDKSFSSKLWGYSRKLTCIKLRGKKGKCLLELYYIKKPKHVEFNYYNHFSITVKDIDKIFIKCMEANLDCYSKPILNPAGTHKLFFCRDYDCNIIEIVEEL